MEFTLVVSVTLYVSYFISQAHNWKKIKWCRWGSRVIRLFSGTGTRNENLRSVYIL